MHVATIRRRHGERVYESHLIRRSVRVGGKVGHETIANVSKLPPSALVALRRALAGETLVGADEAFEVARSLPHGHVAAVLLAAKRLGLARLLDRAGSRERSLVLAMIVQRVVGPGSKLACTRQLGQSTLADELELGAVDADELYAALDWLGERQEQVETRLSRRHLAAGELCLYDLSSSYFEGRHCPLAALGYSRDGRRGTPQIVYGLLANAEGVPVAVEVFAGSTLDQQTVPAQIAKFKGRFGLDQVVLVCDRGMVTRANLDAIRDLGGIDWITALKAPQVKKLATSGALQLSLFDQTNLAEITSDEFPAERLVVCRNPLVGAERRRKREALLAATETGLAAIQQRVERGTLSGAAAIGLAVAPALRRYRMQKHYTVTIDDAHLAFARKTSQIAAEAALDGIYILRTSLPAERLDTPAIVRAYKQLKEVEKAFHALKSRDLEIRPIHHHLEARVRAHVFLCTLAYYLEWHLRQAWRELTFTDEQPPARTDPVAKAARSASAQTKTASRRTTTGHDLHSYRSLIQELATQTKNTIRIPKTNTTYPKLTTPTALQARALELANQITP